MPVRGHRAHGVVHHRILGIERDRLFHGLVRLCSQVLLDAHHAEEEVDGGVSRLERPRVREVAERALVVFQLHRGSRQLRSAAGPRHLPQRPPVRAPGGRRQTARRERESPPAPEGSEAMPARDGPSASSMTARPPRLLGRSRVPEARRGRRAPSAPDALPGRRRPARRRASPSPPRSAARTASAWGRCRMSSGSRSSIARLAANCPSSASSKPLWNSPSALDGLGVQQSAIDRNRLGAHCRIAVGALLIQASEVLVRGRPLRRKANGLSGSAPLPTRTRPAGRR